MYLRLQDAREQRLRVLTKNIRSAHANKPKGKGAAWVWQNNEPCALVDSRAVVGSATVSPLAPRSLLHLQKRAKGEVFLLPLCMLPYRGVSRVDNPLPLAAQLEKAGINLHFSAGRQAKMAFVNSVAKPPRDVRRRQEKFGTGGTAVPEKIR